jgi:ketosteroid isomerase-like protein
MRKFTGMALAATAFVALAACDQAPQKAPATDVAAVEKDLRAIEAQWNEDYNSRDVDAVMGHYAEDAAIANPGTQLAAASDSRRATITQFLSDPNLKISFESDRVQVAKSGDLAYTRGHFTMQGTDPATKQPRTDTGNYLTVWKKQTDGSWKAVEDFVVPGGPATAAAEPAAAEPAA